MTPKVLIVEDQPDTCEMFAIGLASQGFETVRARTALEALTVVDPASLSAVVLDVGLPDLNGFELMREMHTIAPSLPFVVCSGYVDMRHRAKSAGAAAFVPKPCTVDDVSAALGALLFRH